MLSKLLATSLLALQGAAAFLIIPEVDSTHAVDTTNARSLSIATTCSKCPFPETPDTTTAWLSGVDSYMLLNLTTDGGKLFVNQKEIYPAPDKSTDLQTVLVRKSDERFSQHIATGYVLELLQTPESSNEQGPELLTFYFTPLQVGGLPAAADTLYIPVIKTARGNLVIVNSKVEASSAPRIAWRQCGRDAQCWKRLLVARIAATLRAAKTRAALFAAKVSSTWKGCHGKPYGSGRMQGGRMHHGPGHHRYQNPTFSRAFARALRFVIIPAIIGLCISLVVCYIGSLVGHCFVALWRYSRGRRDTHRRSLDSAQENGEAGEKEGLMDDVAPEHEDQLHGQIRLPEKE
ncbi:uncharacterized protein GIQ15_05217 [Arthroderma uncinatum]|uniref:uncharacterized protein n=1 Tax=Arthroderma uncinatum TaxID=74035 RepID=UPI00144A7EA5|nr:uncharacterized protein GIQ15_05217 [Arthroderma uncinatum]KAF3482458.1 hypothetical protein GIQ15_05217 [Arthroderma uncinatum]